MYVLYYLIFGHHCVHKITKSNLVCIQGIQVLVKCNYKSSPEAEVVSVVAIVDLV